VATDLSTRTQPLTYADALHLMRRATLHPTHDGAMALVGKSPSDAVRDLLDRGTDPVLPAWASMAPDPNITFSDAARRWPEIQLWWADKLATEPSVRERMVLFWHNHFTSDYITVYYGQFSIRQNALQRSYALGDFAEFSKKMIGDPAMLIFLNGNLSVKGNPNENFAREWFELFSLGIGNYTENDIVEASRAFTGWRISGLNGTYTSQLSDLGAKTIFGQTGSWTYEDVVRITLAQPACARYLATKLLRTFVQYYPTDDDVTALAAEITAKNFVIKPVLQTLLSSELFLDQRVRGALIKAPADLVIGLATSLSYNAMQRDLLISSMAKLNQELFYPPTVEGWKGHHAWITSSTFPSRQRFGENLVNGKATDGTQIKDTTGKAITPDLVALVKKLCVTPNDPVAVVDALTTYLLSVPITSEQRVVLKEILLQSRPDYEWTIDAAFAPTYLRLFMQAVVRMPEFQLM